MTKFQAFCIAIFLSLYLATSSALWNKKEIDVAKTNFASRMYKTLSKKDGNVFFSPISTHMGLSMLLQGAAGKTAREMTLGLRVPDSQAIASHYGEILNEPPKDGITLDLANKIFIRDDYTIKPKFQDVLSSAFSSPAQSLQFQDKQTAAKTINDWVASKTNNNITDIVSPDDFDESTKMVLVNAIYFRAEFIYKFNKTNTITGPFWITNTEKVDVPMMHTTDTALWYAELPKLDARILELPHEYGPDVNMYIVLPNNRDGIKNLERKFTWDLDDFNSNRMYGRVHLSLPKFKLAADNELKKEVLKELVMCGIFKDSADFQNMVEDKEGLKVSKILQKASIEVNEDGTQTGPVGDYVDPQRFALTDEPTEFIVDHPALIFIRYYHGHYNEDTLFMGRLQNPI